jgi:catechol-2,3-dioxygenase
MSTRIGICHVGIQSQDPHALAAFYRDVLGMAILGGSAPDSPLGATAFLSSQPGEEDHEIAIFEAPRFRHIAFRVASLTALRTLYGEIVARGMPIKLAFNHGVSLAFYFDDPEGNMIEIYWATGVACPQPHAAPIDLARPEAELLQAVALLEGRDSAPAVA